METKNDIWSKLREITKNINLDDDVVEEPIVSNYESYKYESRTKKGANGHIIFLYLSHRKKDIRVLFDTGANHSLFDRKGITLKEFHYKNTIRYKILVKPEDIKDINPETGKYTYEDIEKLILQCYQTLNFTK